MLQIGICDDIPQQADSFKQRLLNGSYTQQELTIHIFHSARELLNASIKPDLLFLDIDMPEMSGMELLEHYGTRFADTKVIFLTSHPGYVFDGYKYHVYRFLPKQNLSDRVLAEVFESFEKDNILNQPLQLFCQGQSITVRLKDIMYMESDGSYCNVTTTTNRWKCLMRLKNIVPLLPEDYFCRTHRAYVINMNYIKEIIESENYILMADDYRVDIAQRSKKNFKNAHTKFLLR